MRIFLGLGAASLLAAGCLLVTSLDGLEGPPLSGGGGGAGTNGGGGGSTMDAAPSDGPLIKSDAESADAPPPAPILFQDRGSAGIPRGIALSDQGVYWAEVSPLGILYAPKDASKDAATAVVHVDSNTDDLNDVFDVALDASYLYWTEYTQGVVHRKPLAGGNMATAYFNGAGHAAYLTMTGNDHVFLTDYNMTIAAIVQGPPSLSVSNNQKPPAAGITFCSSVFWAWGQPSAIATTDPTGTQPSDRYYVPQQAGTITGLACDGKNLYWIENNRSIRWTDRVLRELEAPLYTANQDFAMGNNVGDIAVDDNWIYFTEPLNRAIYKLAKPPARNR